MRAYAAGMCWHGHAATDLVAGMKALDGTPRRVQSAFLYEMEEVSA